jgi:hypothetical protein
MFNAPGEKGIEELAVRLRATSVVVPQAITDIPRIADANPKDEEQRLVFGVVTLLEMGMLIKSDSRNKRGNIRGLGGHQQAWRAQRLQ